MRMAVAAGYAVTRNWHNDVLASHPAPQRARRFPAHMITLVLARFLFVGRKTFAWVRIADVRTRVRGRITCPQVRDEQFHKKCAPVAWRRLRTQHELVPGVQFLKLTISRDMPLSAPSFQRPLAASPAWVVYTDAARRLAHYGKGLKWLVLPMTRKTMTILAA